MSSGNINIPDTKVRKLETNVVAGNVDVVLGDCSEILAHSDSGTINIKNNSET